MGNDYLDFKSDKKIAILDCNNFYVSCERLFDPSLDEQATVVLSNNDGCIIARSQEVKNMGVKMGQPLFKLEDDKKDKITKRSSNYELYGDISDRIVTIIKRLVPTVEPYSIDETFLDLSHIPMENLQSEIKSLKDVVYRLTGIPVSIGVAPNKTLAKLCNHISKTNTDYNGCCSYFHIDTSILDNFEIDEVWGVGRKYKKKLNNINVFTVKDFKNLQPNQVRGLLHITGLRTWAELHEVSCFNVETSFKLPKMITCSRSFGTVVYEQIQVKNAFWTFLNKAQKKLLNDDLETTRITIFATTNRFQDDYFSWSESIRFTEQTSDLQKIWDQIAPYIQKMPHKPYYKCGVMFHDLKEKVIKQKSLFNEIFDQAEIPVVDKQKWQTRRDFVSPAYTTNWNELPIAF
jgi:DNA polymerase V